MNFLYLGPSMGGGMIALIIGFLLSTLLFVVAIFLKPIKFIINKFRKKKS